MSQPRWRLRPGTADDAGTVAALATQVFLDTYAAEGVRPDLAREVLHECSPRAFAGALAEPGHGFVLAEIGEGVVGFAEVRLGNEPVPGSSLRGHVLVRLYVQPKWQGLGLGRALLEAAEILCVEAGGDALWLAAYALNRRALDFYAACGYADVGRVDYRWEDRVYDNRVFYRPLR